MGRRQRSLWIDWARQPKKGEIRKTERKERESPKTRGKLRSKERRI